jgi:hypothetical protein
MIIIKIQNVSIFIWITFLPSEDHNTSINQCHVQELGYKLEHQRIWVQFYIQKWMQPSA